MRITGGTHRGRRLRSLSGTRMRPTADKVREGLFAILGEAIVGRDFLDLYAGTGAVGIEALSRGARRAVLVENHEPAVRLILENLRALGLADRGFAMRGDAVATLPRLSRFDLDLAAVFIDPPYAEGPYETILAGLAGGALVRADTCIVVEHAARDRLEIAPGRVVQTDRRRYGNTALSFFRLNWTASNRREPAA